MNKQTGRFYVKSLKTGKLYLVEPVRPRSETRTDFGESLIEHGSFCNASITEEESIITPENGFTNISYAGNPLDYIERLEADVDKS
jgi:hypothetical protein